MSKADPDDQQSMKYASLKDSIGVLLAASAAADGIQIDGVKDGKRTTQLPIYICTADKFRDVELKQDSMRLTRSVTWSSASSGSLISKFSPN